MIPTYCIQISRREWWQTDGHGGEEKKIVYRVGGYIVPDEKVAVLFDYLKEEPKADKVRIFNLPESESTSCYPSREAAYRAARDFAHELNVEKMRQGFDVLLTIERGII